MRQRTSGLTTDEASPASARVYERECAPRAMRSRTPAFVARFACVLLLALTRTAFAAPGDLDVTGFNSSDPVPSNRGKVVEKIGRSQFEADHAMSVARQTDGKLLIAGDCRGVFVRKLCIARFNSNGSADTTFNPDATQGGTQPDLQPGELILEAAPNTGYGALLAVQPDGRIIVGGTCGNATTGYNDFCVARLLADATLDTSFNAAGSTPGVATVAPGNFYNTARAMLLQPDGKVVLVGSCGVTIVATAMCISRHNSDGTLDTTFNASGTRPGTRVETIGDGNSSYATGVARQSDGKLVVAGSCDDAGTSDFCLFRLTTVGALDSASFGSGGKVITPIASDEDAATGVAVQADGKIVVAGACSTQWVYSNAGVTKFCVARYLSTGALDTSGFNASAAPADRGKRLLAFASTYDGADALLLQTDGKLVLMGRCNADPAQGTGVFCLLRLSTDGSLDATFGSGGQATVAAVANQRDISVAALLQPDGDMVAAGNCFRGAPEQFCLARFKGGPVPVPTCTLNIDANPVVDATTDGLLVTRYLLGLRGTALVTGATGVSPGRNAAQIETHLAGLLTGGTLDADNDGQPRAITDGLLIVRALLGLSGTALTAGASNAQHPNVRNATQVLDWIRTSHGTDCLP